MTSRQLLYIDISPAVLKPDLRDPLAEAGDLGNPLQVLPVGVAVDLEVGLEYLNLLLGEGCSHPFGLLFFHMTFMIPALCRNSILKYSKFVFLDHLMK